MAKTITISVTGDGSFQVDVDGQASPAASVDEVMQLVQQALGGGQEDPQAAWNAEAQKRGPDGMPQPQPPQGGPQMTM